MLFYTVKHGIFTVMSNHTYRWNRQFKLQLTGGGIGEKLAQEAARLYMVWFDRTFKQALISAGISLSVYKRYVDDGWLKSVCVPPGFRWDQTSQQVCQVMPALEDQTLPD